MKLIAEKVEAHRFHLVTIRTHPEEHLSFKQQGIITIFSFGYQFCILVHSIHKTHVLVVAVEMIWLLFLNILSFNFVPTPNKSLRLTRFRRSYVNRPAVVLIKVTLLFCLICDMQSSHFYFFVHILNPGIFRRLAYSKSKSFSEPCQTSTMKHFAKIVTGYNYLHKL